MNKEKSPRAEVSRGAGGTGPLRRPAVCSTSVGKPLRVSDTIQWKSRGSGDELITVFLKCFFQLNQLYSNIKLKVIKR